MIANKFPEDHRVPALLSIIGSEAYKVLRNLLSPDLPQTKHSKVLTDALKKHYSPKPLIIAERFHFYRRTQQVEESTAEFEATLRKLALHCEFGTHLEEALRDRFVCDLKKEAVQKRLLAEADLTLARVVTTAQSMEAADRNAKAFKTTDLQGFAESLQHRVEVFPYIKVSSL